MLYIQYTWNRFEGITYGTCYFINNKPPLSLSLFSVPFREAPAAAVVSSGRSKLQQAQPGRSTLAAPRVLLRSNSDNNLNVNKLAAPHTPSRSPSPSRSPLPSPLRSLSPRRPQQMQNSSNGTVKSMGRGARHPPRSRSPSLGRLGDGDARRHPPQRHSRSVSVYFQSYC